MPPPEKERLEPRWNRSYEIRGERRRPIILAVRGRIRSQFVSNKNQAIRNQLGNWLSDAAVPDASHARIGEHWRAVTSGDKAGLP